MDTSVLKIVLDTNVLIAIIGRRSPYRWIFDRVISGEIVLCVSNDILLEYEEVLSRKTSPDVAHNILSFIDIHPSTVFVKIFFQFGLIRSDPDDNKFVDCAIASDADFILSNDAHFKELDGSRFPSVLAMTVDEFANKYR